MTFDKLKVGMTLWDVHSYVMGNTTMRSIGCWPVQIVGVDQVTRSIVASWNHNSPTKMYEREWKKLREKRPELERTACGSYRIKRKSKAA